MCCGSKPLRCCFECPPSQWGWTCGHPGVFWDWGKAIWAMTDVQGVISMQPFYLLFAESLLTARYVTWMCYTNSFIYKNTLACANLLLKKTKKQKKTNQKTKSRSFSFLPVATDPFKACIQINFGVGNLLCHYIGYFWCLILFIYLQTLIKFTEPYRSVYFKSHNAWVCVAPCQKTKEAVTDCERNDERRISIC